MRRFLKWWNKSSRRDLTKSRKARLQIEQLEAREVPALIRSRPAHAAWFPSDSMASST